MGNSPQNGLDVFAFVLLMYLGGNPNRALEVEIHSKKVKLYTDSKMCNIEIVSCEVIHTGKSKIQGKSKVCEG